MPRAKRQPDTILPHDAAVSPRGSETRRRILDAAARALVAGAGACEIADVARLAGVSVGLSYHYFGSKAGLIAALVEDFYDRFEAAVMDVNPKPGAGWAERERLRLERMVAFHYADALAPLILGRLSREPEVAAVEAARIAGHIKLAAHNIELAQGRREIPADLDAHLLGAMILGGLRQAIGRVLAMPRRPGRERIAAQLWQFIAGTARLQEAGS
ncbi:TetR/AcrR family transcriptional regulator [Ferrovibrio xuzhouensis]|uniref:TetR/AcrR family transcriptional regulator n=1 Tax=Ferrovibrio xuzhouensis TaxID=1576914 RepID=A0ABV7VMK3_9PROT